MRALNFDSRLVAAIAIAAVATFVACNKPEPPPTAHTQEVTPPKQPPTPRRSTGRDRTPTVAANAQASAEPTTVPTAAAPPVRADACPALKTNPPRAVTVSVDQAAVFVQPRVLDVPLVRFVSGRLLPVIRIEGDWLLIRWNDVRWGPRFGYIRCSDVIASQQEDAKVAESPSSSAHRPNQPNPTPSDRLQAAAANQPATRPSQLTTKLERFGGYLEWRKPSYIVVEGQLVAWNAQTRLKAGRLGSVDSIPLGYEVEVKGNRVDDGSFLAQEIDAKPNGNAAYEFETKRLQGQLEDAYVNRGAMFVVGPRGPIVLGEIVNSGPDVDRARQIMSRLVPPYIGADRLRVRVVHSEEWNAAAMDNGAVWVNSGLLHSMSDDEMAIVLGHELAHFTHEHGRRRMKQAMLGQLAAQVGQELLAKINNQVGQALATQGAILALHAWQNGYGRSEEDQADRVGLRYAYEAGYDVRQAPNMWARMRGKYGEKDRVSNFFSEDHARPTERIRNIERELKWNYSQPRR